MESPWIVWILTGRCNLSCKHCYVGGRFSPSEQLGKVRVIELMGEAVELGVSYINFTGGEPLLYPGFSEVLKAGRSLGLTLSIFTNLTLLTPSWAKLLSKLDVAVFSSLDGGKRETHNSNREAGNWEKIMEALKLLRREDVDYTLVMAVSSRNSSEVGSFLKLSCELEASAAIIPTMPTGRALKNRSFIDASTFLAALKLADEASKELSYPVSIWCAPFTGLVANSPWVSWGSCRFSPSIDIAPNGDILLCDVIDVKLSNVRRGLKEAWLEAFNHPLNLDVVRPKLGEPCHSCRLSSACLGGCYARAYLSKGSLSHPDPLCPRVAKPGEAS